MAELTPEQQASLLSGVFDALSSDFNDEQMGYGNFYVEPDGTGGQRLYVEFVYEDTPDELGERAGQKWSGRWQLTYLGGTAKPKDEA